MGVSWTSSLDIGELKLKNRIILSAMTRRRADVDNVPNKLMVEYYSQRATAGLLLTECAAWSPRGRGYNCSGCIYNDAQAEGWKLVTKAVHDKGSLIFLQIFHAGRCTHPSKIEGRQPFAPSALANKEEVKHQSFTSYPVPKQMTLDEIEKTQQQFEAAVLRSKKAGFDGIEIHGANGYLVDEFLRSQSNTRKDKYGGSVQNRARFALELIDIALKHLEPYRVAIKLSPVSQYNYMFDKNPVQTYSHLLKELDKRKIGFVEITQPSEYWHNFFNIKEKEQLADVAKVLRPFFSGIIVNNTSFTPETGLERIKSGVAEAISFGRLYISNPDLPERIQNGWQLDKNVNYGLVYGDSLPADKKHTGYTDYPVYKPKATS